MRVKHVRPEYYARVGQQRQSGVALLALLTLLTLWGLYLFVGQLNALQLKMAGERNAEAALAEAKHALIGRAATDQNRPGSLPCPAIDETGVSPLLIGNQCPSYLGRLPWKTLRVSDLRDQAGERLWYALAPALRDDDSAQPINSQTLPELKLDGMSDIAAIVFSPGMPLADQGGRPSNAVAEYLDGSNNDGDYAFVSGPLSPTFNDRVLSISRGDLFRAVNQRVLGEVRGPADNPTGPPTYALRRYHADHATFPWADKDGDGFGDVDTTIGKLPNNDLVLPNSLAWLGTNSWLPLLTYQRLSPNSARIGIVGSSNTLIVLPCPGSPCP
ncbi:hypothetical protein [Candidatus Accumulibacter vicinus]|uniref:hypothetical protein n=1 Tax=Candidatus Accumulibacter vicinus TaxID=2954382 RepID=UPI00235B6289|nr:hypothetical protein [Candidatus Accumulibacter vicinus]